MGLRAQARSIASLRTGRPGSGRGTTRCRECSDLRSTYLKRRFEQMQLDLKGKVAVVTGGGRDIGRAISIGLAASGASVVVNYAGSREAAEETVREAIRVGGRAVAVQADVTRLEDVARLV